MTQPWSPETQTGPATGSAQPFGPANAQPFGSAAPQPFSPATGQARYKMTAWRAVCGICWAVWTLLFAIGAIVGLANGNVGTFFLAAVLGGLAGWYDYRIWTLKARRLTLFVIF